jgi:hypothetical protein
MVELTEKAQRDARTLKTITILTLIYLPASFVAVSAASRSKRIKTCLTDLLPDSVIDRVHKSIPQQRTGRNTSQGGDVGVSDNDSNTPFWDNWNMGIH